MTLLRMLVIDDAFSHPCPRPRRSCSLPRRAIVSPMDAQLDMATPMLASAFRAVVEA
jgi:hypothetical protein